VQKLGTTIPLGGTAPPSSALGIDARGYFTPAPGAAFGAAPSGTTTVTVAAAPTLSASEGYSLFATGTSTDPSFPPELLLCDEQRTDGIHTVCGDGPSVDVTFQTLDLSLTGLFGVGVAMRRGPILDAMSKQAGADVLCLAEVSSNDDKTAIAAAAKGAFPYSAWFVDTLDTPVNDPRDQSGNVPPPPADASCPAAAIAPLDKLLKCMEDNCSRPPHDTTATLTDDPEVCLSNICGADVLSLYQVENGNGTTCWMCLLGQFEDYSTFDAVRTECTTNAGRAPLAWKGASNTMILSRFPIHAQEQLVLPATVQRETVVRAEVDVGNGVGVDVYCGQTTGPPAPGNASTLLPYRGAYQSWNGELLLQTKQVVDFVTTRSTARGRKAVLMGALHTGPPLPSAQSENADSLGILMASLAVGAVPGYTPSCTLCLDNPLVSPLATAQNAWEDLVLMGRIPVTSVRTSGVVDDERVVPEPDGGVALPLSQHYGYRATIGLRR
jgi:hypothetical protein